MSVSGPSSIGGWRLGKEYWMILSMMKAMEFKQMKRHGPIRKAIMQMRVFGFVVIADYAKELHIVNGKNFND